MTGLSIEDAGKESYIDKAPRRPEVNQARRQTAANKKSPAATSGPAAEKQHGAGEELDAPQQQTKANKSLATSGPEAEKQHGAGEKLDAPQQQTKANKSPATSGLGAEKQCEVDHEEDYSEMAKNFSKIAEKVKKAIPRRYSYDTLPTIYVVPRDLAEGTKDPYEPEVVCIGPLFNQKERRKTKPRHKLESYKWCCLRKLLVNAGVGGGDGCWIPEVHGGLLRKCLDTMRDLEPQIHVSYGDDDISSLVGRSDTLALMMLLDGSFLLHCLMVEYARTKRQAGNSDDDDGKKEDVDDDDDNDDWTQVVGRCGTWEIVTRDLLLLKNQIPFFVLQKLFEHLISRSRASDDSEDYILVKGGLSLFSSLHPGPAAGISSTITCRKVHHLLHLFYLSAIAPTPTNKSSMPRRRRRPRRSQDDDDDDAVPWVRCAKELEHVGVSFKAKKHKQQKWNIFKTTTTTTPFFFHDVSFRHCCGGVLEIPPLELYDYSEALFRNLIAFEQTYLHTRGVVTAYALFMDCLIKTPEDVRLLHSSGVLVSRMNGDRDAAVTGFFSRVCAQAHIFPDQNYLDDVMRDVAVYQSTKRREWRAVLVRDYFVNPWVTTSLIAAFLVLLMTFLQTFFTVYPYYKPHESN